MKSISRVLLVLASAIAATAGYGAVWLGACFDGADMCDRSFSGAHAAGLVVGGMLLGVAATALFGALRVPESGRAWARISLAGAAVGALVTLVVAW